MGETSTSDPSRRGTGFLTKLGKQQPSTPLKFGAGTLVMGLAVFAFLPMPSGWEMGPRPCPRLGQRTRWSHEQSQRR